MKVNNHRSFFSKNDLAISGQKQGESSSLKKDGCEKTYEFQVFYNGGVSTERITVESPIQRFVPDFEVTRYEESCDYAIKYDKESCFKDFQKEEKLPTVEKKKFRLIMYWINSTSVTMKTHFL